MKIGLDAQLWPSSAVLSQRLGLEAVAVRDLGLRMPKITTCFYAASRKADVDVVTKERDFVDLFERYALTPKVRWVTCGNTSNARRRSILEFPTAPEILKGE